MRFATRVKCRPADRADSPAFQILANSQFSTTGAAENRLPIELSATPGARTVISFCLVAIKTRIIRPATFELDRHDIKRAAVVSTARARIHPDTVYPDFPNFGLQAVAFPHIFPVILLFVLQRCHLVACNG